MEIRREDATKGTGDRNYSIWQWDREVLIHNWRFWMVIDLLTDNSQSVMWILCQYVTLFHSLEVMCQLFPFDNGLDLDKYSFCYIHLSSSLIIMICNILYMLPVWINDLWDILIIIIISWESTFKGSEQVGGAATSAPILQQKLLQEKQKIHKSKYVLTKEATCYRFLWSVDFTTCYTLRGI